MNQAVMVAAGVGLGVVAALSQTFSYFYTRLFVLREHGGVLKLMVLGHVLMGVMSLVALAILLPFYKLGPVHTFFWPLMGATLFYLLGQLVFFIALRFTEASRTAPLLGLKVVMLALITTLFMDAHLAGLQWAAVILAVLAAFAINFTGGTIPWPGLLAAVGACLPYCLSDLSIVKLVETLGPVGSWHAPLLAVSMCYALSGVVALAIVPWTGMGTRQDYKYVVPFSAFWFAAMVLLFACFALIGAVYGNIVQSMRGLMTVIVGAHLASMGLAHIEQRTSVRILVQRIAGAAMMVAAIALYTISSHW